MKNSKKILSLLLTLLMICSIIPMGIVEASAAAKKTKAEAVAWINSNVGKNVANVDNAAGYQCVDLVLAYYQFLGFSTAGISGNAKDYATNKLPSSDFVRIKDYNGFVPEPGDIAVWDIGNGEYKSYGHVGLVISADLNNLRIAEVWGGGGSDPLIRANTMPYNSSGWYEHFWGVIRPAYASSVPTTGISLSSTKFTMKTGESKKLTATVSPSNATNKNVTWSSNVPSIATVGNDGTIKAVSPGACTITAKASGGQTASCLVVIKSTNPAPVAFTEYNGHYYELYDEVSSWSDAKADCEKFGGHLVTVTSAQENAVILELAKQGGSERYHLGATDAVTEGDWKWITGETFGYSNWGPGELDPKYGDGEDAAFLNASNGVWADVADYMANPNQVGYICEYESPIKPNAVTVIDGNVYELYDRDYPIQLAERFAEDKSTYLFSPSTESEQTAVSNWLQSQTRTTVFSMGAYADSSRKWHWSNGEIWSYSNWTDGEPNNTNGNEDRANISLGNNCWNDISKEIPHAFVLEYTLDNWLSQGNSLNDILFEKLPEGADPNDYDIITEYRSRDKSTTTSTADTLDGWTKYDSKTSYGAWSSNKSTSTKPAASDTLQITGTWTQYHYFHYLNYYSGCYNIDSIAYGTNKGKHTIERNSPLSKVSLADQGGKQAYGSQTCSCGFNYWFLSGTTLFYNYQTRSKSTMNYFYKWSDWTAWAATPVSASDVKEVETRTVYRLKEKTEPTVDGISVSALPTKTVYEQNEVFSSAGLAIKVNYSDGTSKTVTSGFTVSKPDMTTAGTKAVTVTYEGKTTSFTVTVKEKSADPDAPALRAESVNAVCGQQIKVPVKIENTELGTFTADIHYDSTKLKFIAIDGIPFDAYETNTATETEIPEKGIGLLQGVVY